MITLGLRVHPHSSLHRCSFVSSDTTDALMYFPHVCDHGVARDHGMARDRDGLARVCYERQRGVCLLPFRYETVIPLRSQTPASAAVKGGSA